MSYKIKEMQSYRYRSGGYKTGLEKFTFLFSFVLVKLFCCSDSTLSCKISSCPKLFSDMDHSLSSWPTSFGKFPSYSHYFNKSRSEMNTVLRIYNIYKVQLDYCLLISGHWKKLSAYYALNIMPDTVYVFSFILTNIL